MEKEPTMSHTEPEKLSEKMDTDQEILESYTFRAICRDSMTPHTQESLDEFKQGKGKAYEYAIAITEASANYKDVDDLLRKFRL